MDKLQHQFETIEKYLVEKDQFTYKNNHKAKIYAILKTPIKNAFEVFIKNASEVMDIELAETRLILDFEATAGYIYRVKFTYLGFEKEFELEINQMDSKRQFIRLLRFNYEMILDDYKEYINEMV